MMINTSNLKNYSKEELQDIKDLIDEELKRFKVKTSTYLHPCYNTSFYHKQEYKHWCKLIKEIDKSKTNGYAFVGDFIRFYEEVKIPVGSYIVEYSACTPNCYSLVYVGEKGTKTLLVSNQLNLGDFIRESYKIFNK